MFSWLSSFISGPTPTVSKYTILGDLNYSGANKLFKVQDGEGTTFILKLVPEDSEGNDIIRREYENMKQFNSDHILKPVDCFVISDQDKSMVDLPDNCRNYVGGIALVLEYCEGGDLGSLAVQDLSTLLEYARQIIASISLIHSVGILHRDIKPYNIFRKNGKIVIGDFGESKRDVINKTKTHTKVGTRDYEAPEVIRGKYSHRADAYSLRITLIKLFVPSSFDLSSWVIQINSRTWDDLDVPQNVPEPIRTYVWGMTLFRTEERLGVIDIFNNENQQYLEVENLKAYKRILPLAWRARSNLANVRSLLENCMSDLFNTMTLVQTADNGLFVPNKKDLNSALLNAKNDIGNFRIQTGQFQDGILKDSGTHSKVLFLP